MKLVRTCLLFFISLFASENSIAQLTNQDCLNAIPVCQNIYNQPNAYTGAGSDTAEITPLISCLNSGEKNDVWYIFTVSVSGTLSFTIFPNNPTNDYDFALYNLTNNGCNEIRTNPGLQVACNYYTAIAGCGGVTGANGNTTGACALMNEPTVAVTAGQTYVLNVSNYASAGQGGYILDFSASTASIFDNTPPLLNSVSALYCGVDTIDLVFNENMLCSSFQNSDFTLTGAGGPYSVTAIAAPNCVLGSAYDKKFQLTISPAINGGGNFTFSIVNPVTDMCGNSIALPTSRAIIVPTITVNTSSTNVSCNNGNDGTATVSILTGTGPFSYLWSSGGSTTGTATNLPANIYVCTVSAPGSCPATATFNITAGPPITDSQVTITPATCGANNGSISLQIAGGNAPYTYQWSNGSITLNQSGLAAGNHTLTVTDNKSCTQIFTYNVSTLSTLNSVPQIQNVSCFGGNNGSITLNTTGGSGGYTYQWSPNVSTTNTATNLAPGSYTITIMDGACLIVFNSQVIAQPAAALSATITATPTTCGNNDGTATVSNVAGGTSPYTYVWSHAAITTNTANNLISGTYTCTVTDANNCTLQKTITVSPSNGHTVTVNYLNDTVTCFGYSDGGVTLTVAGGVTPYTYQWSNSLPPNASQNSLSPGTYSATVTDGTGCAVYVSATIHAAAQLILNVVSTTHVLCYAQNTGAAIVFASGGTGNISYQWSPSGGNAANAINLSAGNYNVTATDAKGCNTTIPISITEPGSALTAPITVSNTTCGNLDGVLTINPTGGTSPYTIAWSNGITSASNNNLGAGTYTVTVTDANNCSITQQPVIIGSSAPVITSLSATDATCFNTNNGTATVTVTGGMPAYSYMWSNGGTSASINSLAPGIYTVSITDLAGCLVSDTISVNAPAAITITQSSITNVLCYGQNTGAVNVNVNGGNGGFTYQWSAGGGTSQNLTNALSGNYTLTATDNSGCTQTANFSITQPVAPLAVVNTVTQTSCGNNNGAIATTVSGGTTPYSYVWNDGSITSNIFGLAPAAYTVTVTDANGCTVQQSGTINASSPVSLTTVNVTNVLCNGNTTGGINITVAGGILPYTYLWSNGFSGNNNANIAAGIYTVTINDAVGCMIVHTDTVTEPQLLILITNADTSICLGQQVVINANVSGGVSPYSYVWSNAATSNAITVSPATTTTYTATVTDANGCIKNSQTEIVIYDPVSVSLTTDTTVCQSYLVLFMPVVSGGDGNYVYQWSTGNNTSTETITALNDSIVTLTVSDGCNLNTVTTSTNIYIVPTPVAHFNFSISKGCIPLEVTFTDSSIALANSIYFWDFGDDSTAEDINPVHTFYTGGTFHPVLVITTPAPYNCIGSYTSPNPVEALNLPVASFTYSPDNPTILSATILFDNTSANATNYQWFLGDGASSQAINPEHYYATVGLYPVTLIATNDSMCYDTAFINLEIKDAYALYIPEGFTPNGDGKNDVLVIKGISTRELSVTIFNRWGQLVFAEKGNPVSWNGALNNNGKTLQGGSYIYIADVVDDWGKKHRKKGSVTIIR